MSAGARTFVASVIFILFTSDLIANEVTVSAGLTRSPYLMVNTKNGIEIDIVKEALLRAGHYANFRYHPYRTGFRKFKDNEFDALLLANTSVPIGDVFFSKPYITYQNVAISLTKNKLTVNDIDDLVGKKVIAFSQATKYLGDSFLAKTRNFLLYKELLQVPQQIKMLFSGRVDVIIIDINIFKYFFNKLETSAVDMTQGYKVHPIFNPYPYSVAFHSKELAGAFDQGLAQLKESGGIKRIIDRYIEKGSKH